MVTLLPSPNMNFIVLNGLNKTTRHLSKQYEVVRHCSTNGAVKKTRKYTDSFHIPFTRFSASSSPKENIQKEKETAETSSFSNLYKSQRCVQRPEFILHDGPPYANGKVHVGHALNKISKDIIIRSQLLLGKRIHYTPGWDCHGLPMELAAMKSDKCRDDEPWKQQPPLVIRAKAKNIATKNIKQQLESFKRWGIMTDWDQIYTTYSPTFIAKELRLFGKLFESGYIFRDGLPVHFSPSSATCLAESELVYRDDHISPSLFLGLPLTKESIDIVMEFAHISSKDQVVLVIWTTTPWSLPANVAVCVSNKHDYFILEKCGGGEMGKTLMIWGEGCINEANRCFDGECKILGKISGTVLSRLKYYHPVYKHTCPVVTDLIGSTKGTGLVHVAPTHGKDDFLWAMRHNLPTDVQFVDDKGCYNEAAGSNLRGKSVVEEGSQAVLDIINSFESTEDSSIVLKLEQLKHSFPYDWRTDKPVITVSSSQWFFNVARAKDKAVEVLSNVNIMPPSVKTNLISLIKERPYWCISRQRAWGVPIPVFYKKNGQPIVERGIIEHVASLIEKEGCDIWWSYSEEKLLPPEYVQRLAATGESLPTKGRDILDIWFDSGATNECVLDGVTADMYFEGIDQVSGWFQSSLLLSVAANGKSPYKNLIVHNFVLDEKKRKMSKSLGNIIYPEDITEVTEFGSKGKNQMCGVNLLRLWVADCDLVHPATLGSSLLRKTMHKLNRIKMTLRYCLGAIGDFKESHKLPYADRNLLDKYFLWQLNTALRKVWSNYETYNTRLAFVGVYNLFLNISGGYNNSRKDTLNCDADCQKRRSYQSTMHEMLPYLLTSVAPILPHLAEYAASCYSNDKDLSIFSSFCDMVKPPDEWDAEELIDLFNNFTDLKILFLDVAREEKYGKSSVQLAEEDSEFELRASSFFNYEVVITFGEKYQHLLRVFQEEDISFGSDLVDAFQVSKVELKFDAGREDLSIKVEKAKSSYCLRCHKYNAAAGCELCKRCEDFMSTLNSSRPTRNTI